ncbi:MAG: hypothetical protein K2G20_05910 [Lachnospiraceae bacterium]|nr:hypothetical protein [Lachnospiraceae bacterium]
MMESKKINMMWGISLFVIGVATMILASARIAGIELPHIVIVMIGIVELTALPFFAFSTVKKMADRK